MLSPKTVDLRRKDGNLNLLALAADEGARAQWIAAHLAPDAARAAAGPEDLLLVQSGRAFHRDTPWGIHSTGSGGDRGLAILRRAPPQTHAWVGFQVQPNGSSAIWGDCIGATSDTVIVWGGNDLQTTFGGASAVSGLVPKSLYAEAGDKVVFLLDTATGLRSESALFEVKP